MRQRRRAALLSYHSKRDTIHSLLVASKASIAEQRRDPKPGAICNTTGGHLRAQEGLVVKADLPGVARDSMDLRVENNLLTIRAKAAHVAPG